jgi:hypothetical protein
MLELGSAAKTAGMHDSHNEVEATLVLFGNDALLPKQVADLTSIVGFAER